MKFMVTVVRSGGVVVEAANGQEAMAIVNDRCVTDDIKWDDDWMVTDIGTVGTNNK